MYKLSICPQTEFKKLSARAIFSLRPKFIYTSRHDLAYKDGRPSTYTCAALNPAALGDGRMSILNY